MIEFATASEETAGAMSATEVQKNMDLPTIRSPLNFSTVLLRDYLNR
jgi:hypothetical protein